MNQAIEPGERNVPVDKTGLSRFTFNEVIAGSIPVRDTHIGLLVKRYHL